MNREQYAALAAQAREGDQAARGQLLRLAHMPVSYLCNTILQNEQNARRVTREVLTQLHKQLDTLPPRPLPPNPRPPRARRIHRRNRNLL